MNLTSGAQHLAQNLIGELMALGFDANLFELEPGEYAATVAAGTGLWVVTNEATAAYFDHPDHFLRLGREASWATYMVHDFEGWPLSEEVAAWFERLFANSPASALPPAPARPVRRATAPAYTVRDPYQGKWMITPVLGDGRRASVFTAAELAEMAPNGIIWESFGTVVAAGREGFCRSRYIADADGHLHFYDSDGGKVSICPPDRGVRLLAKA